MDALARKTRRAALLDALHRKAEDGDQFLADLRQACAEVSASLADGAEAIKLRITALELAIIAVADENDLGPYGDALTQLTQDLLVAIEELEARFDFRGTGGD